MSKIQSYQEVSEINRNFYDNIAYVYDQIDSRRKKNQEHPWLDHILTKIRQELPQNQKITFLDAGAGSGFLSYKAQSYFDNLILLDISQKMLERIKIPNAKKIVGDCSKMPIEDNSLDVIGAFATMHHLFDPQLFLRECQRTLKIGGILYTDHDIEQSFAHNNRFLLSIYRFFFDHGKKYLKSCPQLSEQDYKITEYHGDNGLSFLQLKSGLESAGFKIIEACCHWQGMGPVAKLVEILRLDKVLGTPGRAPVVRLIAQKIK